MAGSGLLAGLEGYASVAERPAKRLGEGIVGAVDQGIGAYTATSRVRQGEEEGARSQQRLDMAQAMQPGQLREQNLNLDAKSMAITEAGRRVERQKRQEAAGVEMQARVKSGWYKDHPQDYKIDILNYTMIGEDHAQVQAAFKDYNMAVVHPGETADQLNAITGGYLGAHQEAEAHTGPKAPAERIKTWADFIAKAQKDTPVGAAASPEFKHAHTILGALIDKTQPRPIKEGFEKYTQARASDPRMSATQAWHAAQVGMDPQDIGRMNDMLKPADVKAEEEAARKGGDVAAEEKAKQPGRVELENLKGQNARDLEAIKAKSALEREGAKTAGRMQVRQTDDKNLKLEIDTVMNDMKLDTKTLTNLVASSEQKAAAEDRLNINRDRLGVLTAEAHIRSTRKVAGGGQAGDSGAPAGMTERGNIDLTNRPRVQNADGSVSTLRSMSFREGTQEILIPTVSDDGRIMSPGEAIQAYRKTGRHLGKFTSPEDATAYAKALSSEQGKRGAQAAPAGPPRQVVISGAVTAIKGFLNTPSKMPRDARIKHQLSSAVANGQMTQQEADSAAKLLAGN
jgi:hypothetical protein